MIEALVSGKLLKDAELKTSSNGKLFCNFMLSVWLGGDTNETTIISGIAFGEQGERISGMKKGDALSVAGSLKPSQWTDKTSGETKHGLSITVSKAISLNDANRTVIPFHNSTGLDK